MGFDEDDKVNDGLPGAIKKSQLRVVLDLKGESQPKDNVDDDDDVEDAESEPPSFPLLPKLVEHRPPIEGGRILFSSIYVDDDIA